MDALQFNSKCKKLCLIKAPKPQCSPTHVVVKISYSGICGTDLHIIEGDFPCADKVILGHEMCGVVDQVGKDVSNFEKGDRVVVDPNCACGECDACCEGNYQICQEASINSTIGIWSDGGWAQYCSLPAKQVHAIPETVTFEQAVLTEPISCIIHGLKRAQSIRVGQQILIQGAGIIGALWCCILHQRGHKNVSVVEPWEARRKSLAKLETDFRIMAPCEIEVKKTKDPDFGFDVVIDCSGNVKAIESGFNLLLPGGKMVVFGVPPPKAKIKIQPHKFQQKEVTVVGSIINPFTMKAAIACVESMGKRYFDFEKLGIKAFKLSQYSDAFDELEQGKITKGMFKLISTCPVAENLLK